jgi:nicotinate-nucleotide adenylyltransferase
MPGETNPVGVLGGTFDPVHNGHLYVAGRVQAALGLESMLLIPSARPPHKRHSDLSAARHREAMLRLAVRDRPGLEVSALEIERDALSYTIDTLRILRGGEPTRDPVFVLGMDALLEIETWHEWPSLIREFDLVVVDRPGSLLDDVRSRLSPPLAAALQRVERRNDRAALGPSDRLGRGGRIFHLELTAVSISASEIRARVAAGLPIAGLVPDPVGRYIQQHGLYGWEESSE